MGNENKATKPASFMSINVSNRQNLVINNHKLEIYLSLKPNNYVLTIFSAQMLYQQGKLNPQVQNRRH